MQRELSTKGWTPFVAAAGGFAAAMLLSYTMKGGVSKRSNSTEKSCSGQVARNKTATPKPATTLAQTQEVSDAASTGRISVGRYMDMIGNTPLIDLTSLVDAKVPGVKVYGKAEFMNPGFSIKDRIIRKIFLAAEKKGELKAGMTVVCASSGNTGAACAMMCAARGYNCVIITSGKCSKEKRDSIRSYGAKLLIARPDQNYMQMELDMAAENPDWFSVNQYDNLDNPLAHYESTGPEIWRQTGGKVTHFVAAGSTGGTVSGTGKFLKDASKGQVRVTLADPNGSIFHGYFDALRSGVRNPPLPAKGKFLVEGVGKGNIPGAMNFSVIDDTICVSDREAFAMCKKLAMREGLSVGGSSGLNVTAAVRIAEQLTEPGVVVTILCDLGVKYLSKVYNDDWLKANNVHSDKGETNMTRSSPRSVSKLENF